MNKRNIWCMLGFHKWVYFTPDKILSQNEPLEHNGYFFRTCKHDCGIIEELINPEEHLSGLTSDEEWVKIY